MTARPKRALRRYLRRLSRSRTIAVKRGLGAKAAKLKLQARAVAELMKA